MVPSAGAKNGFQYRYSIVSGLKKIILLAVFIQFNGFIESRDLLDGKVDIVISDGFTGNIMLKLIEGMFTSFDELLKKHNLNSKDLFNEDLLYEKHGGAPFLGVEGIIVKCHGSSSYVSIENSILQVLKLYNTNLIDKISVKIAETIETIIE